MYCIQLDIKISDIKKYFSQILQSLNRGKIEIVLYRDFTQCETDLSRLGPSELGDGDSPGDFRYKNKVYFNAKAAGKSDVNFGSEILDQMPLGKSPI